MADDAYPSYDVPVGGVDWEALRRRMAPYLPSSGPRAGGPGPMESAYNYLFAPTSTQQQQLGGNSAFANAQPFQAGQQQPQPFMAQEKLQGGLPAGGMPAGDPMAGQTGFNPFLYSTMPGGTPPSNALASPAYGVSLDSGKSQDYLGGGEMDKSLRRAQFEASRPEGVQREFKTDLGPIGVSEAAGQHVPGYQGGQQGGGQSGFMHWQDLARDLIRANPGIRPDVAAMAIMQFMPLMNQQSQTEMQMISRQMGLEQKAAQIENMGARTDLAQQRLEFDKQKQEAEFGQGGASLKHLEKAYDQAEKADAALLRARTASGADKKQQDLAISEAVAMRDAAYKRVAEIERTRNPEKFAQREKEQRVQQLTQYLTTVEQAVRDRKGTPEEALAQVAKSLPPQVVERLKKEGSTTEELAYLLLNPRTRDAALKVIGQQ